VPNLLQMLAIAIRLMHVKPATSNWTMVASNLLLILGVASALLAIGSATKWFARPALIADPSVIELGELATNQTVPLSFTVRNQTSKPVRLLGALYAP